MEIYSHPIDVYSVLMQLRGRRVAYIPNPGNAGDSVIAAATYQVLDRLGITYHIPDAHRFNASGWSVVYGGGGNMINPRTFSSRMIQRFAASADELIVLPHTIKNNDQLIEGLGGNTTIICRERYSFDYLVSKSPRCRVAISDDMAFHLKREELTTPRKSSTIRIAEFLVDKLLRTNAVPLWANVLRSNKCDEIISRLRTLAPGESLNCFRLDGEMTDAPIPSDNIDLSEILQFGVETSEIAKFCTRTLLDFISCYKSVSTNRLHVAISAALLGVKVNFYPNNYFKCKGIYEFSMRDRFPNVKWMGG